MEITLELAHNMFKAASIFSLNYTGHGDVLSPDNPFKEWDAWKEKAEALELKCTNLQEELFVLQEEANATNSLREALKIHDSPFYLGGSCDQLGGFHLRCE